jgi:hypothetical protein
MIGKLSMVYPFFNLVWTLYSVDKGRTSTLEKMMSLFFQLFTIASLGIEVSLALRIIFTSYSLIPPIQAIYRRKYNRNAERWT